MKAAPRHLGESPIQDIGRFDVCSASHHIFFLGLLAGCATISGMQQRFAACSYDHAWEAALAAVKDRPVTTKNKEAGFIETGWLEIPMPGRTYGAFRGPSGTAKIDPALPST